MTGRPRRAIIRPWNMLLLVGMFIVAVLAGWISDRVPALPPEIESYLVLLAGTVTLAIFVKELLVYLSMRRWPEAEGVVIRSETVRIDDGESIIYRPLVQCSYQVDGTGHTTEALYPGCENHSSSFESHWRKVIDRYPVGTEVKVTYNPQDRSEAYLRKANAFTAVGALIITLALLALYLLAP